MRNQLFFVSPRFVLKFWLRPRTETIAVECYSCQGLLVLSRGIMISTFLFRDLSFNVES